MSLKYTKTIPTFVNCGFSVIVLNPVVARLFNVTNFIYCSSVLPERKICIIRVVCVCRQFLRFKTDRKVSNKIFSLFAYNKSVFVRHG